MSAVNESANGPQDETPRSLTKWIVSTPVTISLLMALVCLAIFLYAKPDWSFVFIGWWLTGLLIHRAVVGEDDDLSYWMDARAATLVLIVLFIGIGIFAPQVLTALGILMVAALGIYFVVTWVRGNL